jgi:hypothetical protein
MGIVSAKLALPIQDIVASAASSLMPFISIVSETEFQVPMWKFRSTSLTGFVNTRALWAARKAALLSVM